MSTRYAHDERLSASDHRPRRLAVPRASPSSSRSAVAWLGWMVVACSLWIVAIFVLQFFRDPPRDDPARRRRRCCRPADGRDRHGRASARDPYLDRDALKISVFMNVFNVHSQPQPGRRHGARTLVPRRAASSTRRSTRRRSRTSATRCTSRRATGSDVTCVQIAGLIARRILCYVEPGDALARGQRYGFIRFGSRVDVYLPPSATPKVAIGDMVYGDRRRSSPSSPDAPACPDAMPAMQDYEQRARACSRTACAGAASTSCRTSSRPRRCSPASTRSCRR